MKFIQKDGGEGGGNKIHGKKASTGDHNMISFA